MLRSSSTIRTRPCMLQPPVASKTRKQLPWPGSLATSIQPPCSCTIRRRSTGPARVPSPTSLVVKKVRRSAPGSRARSLRPGRRRRCRAYAASAAVASLGRLRRHLVRSSPPPCPPSGIDSTALTIRLVRTCWIWPASMSAAGVSGVSSSSTVLFAFLGDGCQQLNRLPGQVSAGRPICAAACCGGRSRAAGE